MPAAHLGNAGEAPSVCDEGSAADALARSNLLRLETSELLSESTLHVHPVGDANHVHYEARWAPLARGYLKDVRGVVQSLEGATLSPETAVLPGGVGRGGKEGEGTTRYRVPLLSDKFAKSTRGNNPLTSWSFPFAGGESLSLVPVGSFAHVGNAGLTNRRANGNVVPVLDVAVLFDGSRDGGENAFVGGKDYSNYRYTDKRNILAVHVAKQLAQKKHRSKIGAVHLTHIFGDSRKVGMVLTPPLDNADNPKKPGKKKQKRNKENERSKDKGRKNKLRFRIRLIFGVKQGHTQGSNSAHQQNDDDDDEYSSSDGKIETAWSNWIPRSRLLPDRSNNRSGKFRDSDNDEGGCHSTPHYTNSLAEDLHLLSTTDLVSSTISTLVPTSGSNVTPTSSFHETLLLLKVWALQRGFLRGHDAFTTTTLAVLLVYLYRTKGIGRRMGAMQAFTAFMKFWSESDWLGEDAITAGGTETSSARIVKNRKVKKKSAFVIPVEGKSEAQTISCCPQSCRYLEDVLGKSDGNAHKTLLDCYKACYTSSAYFSSSVANDVHVDSPILLDPTMTINYLARLSPSFVRESRGEACVALRCIHGQERRSDGGAFHELFMETNRFWTRYDAYARIPLEVVPKILEGGGNKKKHGKVSSGAASNRVWGRDVDDLGHNESVCRGVVEVLSRALGDRATAIRALAGGNGDFRGAISNDGETEDVATRIFTDSNQQVAIPIRGRASQDFGYTARVGERCPEPPIRAASSTYSNNDGEVEQCLVVGLRIDPGASRRVVDRGPPAEDVEGSAAFTSLWGERHAQLRRFHDGAIVRAVVWNGDDAASAEGGTSDLQFGGMDRSMGGIVEKILRHIVWLHFTDAKVAKRRKGPRLAAFELRNMISFIDGVSPSLSSYTVPSSPFADSLTLHKNAMSAFESLSEFLRRNTATTTDKALGKGRKASNLGLPLSVDEIEPLSPCLRYSALFPPVPHPLLGGSTGLVPDERKVSGANGGSPILIQLRFEGSSKWPTSLNAMGAAKCAMLAQLAEGIKKMKQEKGSNANGDDLNDFDGPIDVTPSYLDIGYRGYSWRIIIRADQELRMLRSLSNPTAEAKALQLSLINRHVRGAMHHSLIHAVHTRHPSASSVVRLAHRWVASHMLSDMIPHEAVELIVAKIYTGELEGEVGNSNRSKICCPPPSTVVAGFLKFLQLLSSHDWARKPLIVDPQNHISSQNRGFIHAQFNNLRGQDLKNGPAMYIISPADYDGVETMVGSKVIGDGNGNATQQQAVERIWAPTVTAEFPERVVLFRAAALAKYSFNHLTGCIRSGKAGNGDWVAAFQESSASLTSYSVLLRVDPSYVTDQGCSSTIADHSISGSARPNNQDENGERQVRAGPFEKSLQKRYAGPKELRKKHYKNLVLEKDTLHEWQPVTALVKALRSKFRDYALFFYNEFSPDVIAVVWRPDAFKPQPFSAVVSEFKRPTAERWKEDSLVITSTDDLIAEIGHFSKKVVSNIKVFDDKKPHDAPPKKNFKRPHQEDDDDKSSDSEEE